MTALLHTNGFRVLGLLAWSLALLSVAACRSISAPSPAGPPVPRVAEPATPRNEFVLPRAPQPVDGIEGPLRLSLEEAVLQTLENNRTLRVQRLEPIVAGTFEALERGVFDPVLSGEISSLRERTERFPDELDEPISDRRESTRGLIGLQQALPTGTEIDLSLAHAITDSDRVAQTQHGVRAGLSVTQALLRGGRPAANLASLRQARLDTRISEFELRGFAEALTADVESAYWDFVLARRALEIFEDSAALAERQRQATRDRIELGQIAAVEIAAAEAELAVRRQALINARSDLEAIRLTLLRRMNPWLHATDWDREVQLLDEPSIPETGLDAVTHHVRAALAWRPEIHESNLLRQRRALEVVQTRNGLLPRLDFFVTLGKTGFSDSFNQSLRNIDGDGYDARLGLRAEMAIGNRQNRARDLRARTLVEQADESLENLRQLIELDVRTAYNEARRAQDQIVAGAATRRLQEEVLRTEMEKFDTGLSTVLDVAQVQRDLLEAQIAEVGAVTDFRKALVELYRLEGTLLVRRGIGAPGEWRLPAWEPRAADEGNTGLQE